MNTYKLFCVPQKEGGFWDTPIRDEIKYYRDKNAKEQQFQMELRYSGRLSLWEKQKWNFETLNSVCEKLKK